MERSKDEYLKLIERDLKDEVSIDKIITDMKLPELMIRYIDCTVRYEQLLANYSNEVDDGRIARARERLALRKDVIQSSLVNKLAKL